MVFIHTGGRKQQQKQARWYAQKTNSTNSVKLELQEQNSAELQYLRGAPGGRVARTGGGFTKAEIPGGLKAHTGRLYFARRTCANM